MTQAAFTEQLLAATFGGKFPAVDTIRLGPDVMPGQWLLQATSLEFHWLEQPGYGLSGATARYGGDKLVEASFLVRFWRASDWAAFQPLRHRYLSKAVLQTFGPNGYAIGIVHPELNALGVDAVVPKRSPAFINNGKGLWLGTVTLLQYRKPRPAVESPAGALPAYGAPVQSSKDALAQQHAGAAAESQTR